MCQINITNFFKNATMMDYSASAVEIGNNAGTVTWRNACNAADEWLLLDDDEKREAFKEWIKYFGAWSDDECEAWSDDELNALFLQFVSGDIREGFKWSDVDDIWTNYQELAYRGTVSSNIWRDDAGNIFYSLER